MYKSRKSRLKLSGTRLFLKKQLKPLWVNWPKMIGVIWQKFRFFNSAWMLEVALLLSATLTVANLSLQIQWFPFLYHLYCSYELKMIFFLRHILKRKKDAYGQNCWLQYIQNIYSKSLYMYQQTFIVHGHKGGEVKSLYKTSNQVKNNKAGGEKN